MKSFDPNFDPRTLIESHEVETDGVLTTFSTIIGVICLEIFARRHNPNYIIGVNRGGWLLSTYLAHRLNINRENLLRFDSTKNQILEDFESHLNQISGGINILLVDDISRKGDSINKAVEFVKKYFPKSIQISVGVLVVCGEKKTNINYNPYCTRYKAVVLPWSSEERQMEARRNINAQGKVLRLDEESSLDEKAKILRIADAQARNGGEVDISIDDVDTVLKMIGKFFHIPDFTPPEFTPGHLEK